MPSSLTQPRQRARLAVALISVVTLLLTACSPEQMGALDRINDARTAHGLPTVVANPTAMDKAQAWAEQLAATGSLRHSVLSEAVSPGWVRLAENVGHGSTVDEVQWSFLNSPQHKANMLYAGWNSAGTGVARAADGTVYVVQVFLQYP